MRGCLIILLLAGLVLSYSEQTDACEVLVALATDPSSARSSLEKIAKEHNLRASQARAVDASEAIAFVREVRRRRGIEAPDPREAGSLDNDLADFESNYVLGPGEFILLKDRGTGRIVGTAAIFPQKDDVVEFRKFYIAEEYRGLGLGRAMLHYMRERSVARGFSRMVLETHASLTEANSLYRAEGFERTDFFMHPEANLTLGLTLVPSSPYGSLNARRSPHRIPSLPLSRARQ